MEKFWLVSFTRQDSSSSSEKVEMKRRQQHLYAVVLVLLVLMCGVICQHRQCCPSISVSSTSVGEEYQAVQLGIYTIKDNLTVNERPVYKQVRGDQYFYYWVSTTTTISTFKWNKLERKFLLLIMMFSNDS